MRGNGSHYTDTSEPVDGNGAQNGHCPNQGPFDHTLTNCANQAHNELNICFTPTEIKAFIKGAWPHHTDTSEPGIRTGWS
jgi:hypothetical protein